MTREESLRTTKVKLKQATNKDEFAKAIISHFKEFKTLPIKITLEESASIFNGNLF